MSAYDEVQRKRAENDERIRLSALLRERTINEFIDLAKKENYLTERGLFFIGKFSRETAFFCLVKNRISGDVVYLRAQALETQYYKVDGGLFEADQHNTLSYHPCGIFFGPEVYDRENHFSGLPVKAVEILVEGLLLEYSPFPLYNLRKRYEYSRDEQRFLKRSYREPLNFYSATFYVLLALGSVFFLKLAGRI